MLQFPFIPSPEAWLKSLQRIEVLTEVLRALPVVATVKQQVFHRQQLKSSLFSARIEGNTLTWETVNNQLTSKTKSQREISNVVKALQQFSAWPTPFEQAQLLKIHSLVMADLDRAAGKFRYEPTAIYDQYGSIVYLTPLPEEMHQMLKVWVENIKATTQRSWQEQLLQIVACHYYFEKIHPFIDGNGRTGRVVMQYQLWQTGLFTDLIIPIDQYFDEHKSEYYALLEKNTRQLESFYTFFLEGVIWAMEACLADLKQTGENHHEVGEKQLNQTKIQQLFPRRQELYYLIQDHPFITLENVARRFPTIPARTLAYDVSQLVKAKLVTKHGNTKGVMYSIDPQSQSL